MIIVNVLQQKHNQILKLKTKTKGNDFNRENIRPFILLNEVLKYLYIEEEHWWLENKRIIVPKRKSEQID